MWILFVFIKIYSEKKNVIEKMQIDFQKGIVMKRETLIFSALYRLYTDYSKCIPLISKK